MTVDNSPNDFSPDRNAAEDGASLDIYLIAIGGTGMAPLACLLKSLGHRVRGSDGPLYPPMSTLLEEAGIEPYVGFDPAHLDPPPDLVVVGNAVPRSNPEAEAVERRGLPRASMPETLARFFLTGRRPLVVAGTHGKTTTTSMAAWVWHACGREPGYLVGGIPKNLGASFAAGRGDRFIVEGDEYNASYFDRGPKFLHYQPETLILTSSEYDHADLYPSPEALEEAYARLIELVPESGLLAACGDWPAVRRLAERARCRVAFYGLSEDNDVRLAGPPEPDEAGTRFTVLDPEAGEVPVYLPMWGSHNVTNALGVWTAARRDGLSAEEVARALGTFAGAARRLDEVGGAGGIHVVDDFAHHPTAVDKTLEALAERYPGRRILALYEPRSLTAGRSFLFDGYVRAFRRADVVIFAPIFHADRLSDEETLDLEALAAELRRPKVTGPSEDGLSEGRNSETATSGVTVHLAESHDEVFERALAEAREGDVIVTMSSSSFSGMPRRLAEELARRRTS